MPDISTYTKQLKQNIIAEQNAIDGYLHILKHAQNGSESRSIRHILNEERDHKKILTKILHKYER